MIINSTLTAFALDPDEENLPVIGWHNVVTATGVTSTTEVDGYPPSNLANPATHLLWRGDVSASDEYLTVTTGYSDDVDYLAVARHNFGSAGLTCSVEGCSNADSPPEVWIELFEPTFITDDAPLIFRFQPGTYDLVRLRIIQGIIQPEAAVLYVGKLLVIERSIRVDARHTPFPLGQVTKTVTGMSESGQFLGRIILSRKAISTAEFSYITPTWYRENMQEVIEGAQEDPFFFAWDPGEYPEETGFAWLAEDAIPEVDPVTRRVDITLKMEGLVSGPLTSSTSTINLELETIAYQDAIVSAGGTLTGTALVAVNNFVVDGKGDGWWDKIIDASMCVGSNLAAALVKIVVAPTTSASYSNNGPFVGGDYAQASGIGDLSNTSKYLGTGVIPSGQSMSIDNMAIAAETIQDGFTGALALNAVIDPYIADNPASGSPHMYISSSTLGSSGSQSTIDHGQNGARARMVSRSSVDVVKASLDNVLILNGSHVGTTPTTEITICRSKVSGSFVYGRVKVGATFIFDEGLTDAEQKSFGLALLRFNRAVRTQAAATRSLILGDSHSMTVNLTEAESWVTIVASSEGFQHTNLGISACPLRTPGAYFAPHIIDVVSKYQDGVDIDVDRVFIFIGYNDAHYSGTGSTPPATFQGDLEDICQFYVGAGCQVVLMSPPWTGPAYGFSMANYASQASAAAAAVPGVIFVDIYQALVDTGVPENYYIEAPPNGFHLNAAGDVLIANTVLAAL